MEGALRIQDRVVRQRKALSLCKEVYNEQISGNSSDCHSYDGGARK